MDLNIHPPLPRRKDFRIGILGSGFIVNDCHLVAYRKAGFNPVAIASRKKENAERVARRHGIANAYAIYDKVLDDPTIEVLDIAVPPDAQLGLIKAACERKTVKGILAQKPLGTHYAEAVEAVRACEAAGITLAVNQNMRYDQSVRAGKTLLEKGVLGEPVFATIEMRAIPHWMPWQKDLGWLTLRIMSIHHLDTFRYWFGDPEGIYCSIRTDPRTRFPHSDGICTYILEYPDTPSSVLGAPSPPLGERAGVRGCGLRCVGIDDTWAGPAKEGCPSENYIRWRIEGTDGLAIGDIGWCKEAFTTPSTIRYASKGDKAFHEPRWTESWFPDAFIGTMAQLLIALENGTEPEISGRDNLKTMALVEAAYRSASQFRSKDVAEIEPAFAVSKPWPKKKEGFFKRIISGFTEKHPISSPPAFFRPTAAEDSLSNFTPRAQQILALARREADRFNHNFVGTEHLLLGLIELGQGVAVNVLKRMGLDPEAVRNEVEKQVGTGPDQKMIGNIPYTPRVKKVLALAAKEAKKLNHTYVGTEHILLGLLVEGDGVAALVLRDLHVDIEHTRQEVLKELDPNFAGPAEKQTIKVTSTTDSGAEQLQPMPDFTPRAQQALGFARQEADTLNHAYVGTEHLLLGLIRLGSGVAVNVLLKLGMDIETTRKEVLNHVAAGPPQKTFGSVPYTGPLKRALAFAAKEAHQLRHTYVGTEHVLLGILRLEEGIAAKVFAGLSVDREKVRQEILKELDPNSSEQR